MVDVKPLIDLRKTIEEAISKSITTPTLKTSTSSYTTPKPLKEVVKR